VEAGQSPRWDARPIAARVGADPLKASPEQIADIVIEFLNEQDQAQSAYLLYFLHKDDIATWGSVRKILLSRVNSHRLFIALTNVLEISMKRHLDYSFSQMPGLLNIVQSHQIR
jgi:hypothetical protein